MSSLIKLYEVWDGISGIDESLIYTPKYDLKEDYLFEDTAPKIDGKIILGKVTGPFFFGDGISRNKRFYPRAVWENQLSNPVFKERLNNRTCFGTVGHYEGPVSEEDISKGLVSHITTSLKLGDNNIGIGEALILNTEAGRNIYTLFKAGSRIKVSSRAQGKFLEGETYKGLPVVDPNSFILEGFDWVIAPGFIQTDPQLQESLKEVTDRAIYLEHCNKKIFGINSNCNIQENLKEKNKMNEELLNEMKRTNSVYETLYKEQKKLREEAEEEKEKVEDEKEKVEKELEECKKQLAKYRLLGEAEELTSTLKEYEELGITSPTEARFILETLKEEAEGAIDAEEVEDLKKDIEESMKLLAKYEELGTPEELADIKDKAEELVDELEKKEIEESIKRFTRKYRLSEKLVRKIVEASEDPEEAEEAIKDIADEKEADKETDKEADKPKDDLRRFSNFRRDRLEGMADAPKTSVDDFEDDHNLPNKVNDNDVEAVPNVVDEMLESLLKDSKKSSNSSIMEGYKPGSIVNQMFS